MSTYTYGNESNNFPYRNRYKNTNGLYNNQHNMIPTYHETTNPIMDNNMEPLRVNYGFPNDNNNNNNNNMKNIIWGIQTT